MGRRRRARARPTTLLPRACAAGGATSHLRLTTRGVRRVARGLRGCGARGGGDPTTPPPPREPLAVPVSPPIRGGVAAGSGQRRPADAAGGGHRVNGEMAPGRAGDPKSNAASRAVRAACGLGRRPRRTVGPLALLAAGSPVGGTGVSRPPPFVRLAVGARVASNPAGPCSAWYPRAEALRAGGGPGRTRSLRAATVLPRCAFQRHESPAGGGPHGAATNIDRARGRLDTPASMGLWGCGAARGADLVSVDARVAGAGACRAACAGLELWWWVTAHSTRVGALPFQRQISSASGVLMFERGTKKKQRNGNRYKSASSAAGRYMWSRERPTTVSGANREDQNRREGKRVHKRG